MKIFLSFSFRYGQDLTRAVERLLASHDVAPITGRRLAGEPVDAAVKTKITEADALISLVVRNPNPQQGEGLWSQAVNQEYDFATNRPMPCIAVVEDGLAFQGMNPKERIKYDPANPMETILQIAETVAEWRRTLGQELRVQILPSSLADKLDNDALMKCSHRYWEKDIPTPWKDVQHISEEEGTFIYLRGLREVHRIELQVTGPQKNVMWKSKARFPWPMVQLKETKNG
jgi:hypothetical protein